jgi:hypothetical protein
LTLPLGVFAFAAAFSISPTKTQPTNLPRSGGTVGD